MSRIDPARIASHLEQLPLELHETILVNLSFRDVIALAKYAPEGSRIAAALFISPTWSSIWPTYLAHKDDFQALVSLMVPIGGNRLFDPTNAALDVTPRQFHRRMAREQAIHGHNYEFFEYTTRQAPIYIQALLGTIDPVTILALCRTMSLGQIATITPWLKVSASAAQDVEEATRKRRVDQLRDLFFDTMSSYCKCQIPGPEIVRQLRPRTYGGAVPCDLKHPGRPTPEWTVAQMKGFVDAYSAFQTKLNTAKAQQLRTLARLYPQHHTRLREPLAPQLVRKNIEHVPQQLNIVAGFVSRIIDIDRRGQPGTKQGKSRFRYRHPCLTPYDWCLRLWFRVTGANPALLDLPPEKSLELSMKGLSVSTSPLQPPAQVVRYIQTVKDGLETYYVRDEGDGKDTYKLPRIKIYHDDPNTYAFAVHHEHAIARVARQTVLPPVHAREMNWLVAFLKVVEWMESAHPDLALEEKARPQW